MYTYFVSEICKTRFINIRDALAKSLNNQKVASGQEFRHVSRYKYQHLLDWLIPHINNDGATLCSLTMMDSIQQSSQPVTESSEPPQNYDTATESQSDIASTSRSAAGTASQPSNPEQSSQDPGQSAMVPRPAPAPGHSSTAPGQSSTAPGQPDTAASLPSRGRKFTMEECLSRTADTLDSLQKNFDDPIWTALMGYAAVIRPLSTAEQNQILSDFANIVAPFRNN